jgi:hypothetical protein
MMDVKMMASALEGHKGWTEKGSGKRFRRKLRVENWINFDLKKKRKKLKHSSAVDFYSIIPSTLQGSTCGREHQLILRLELKKELRHSGPER